jgi:hypothetical protein
MWTRVREWGAWDKQSGEVLTRSLARVETRVAVCGARGHEAACQRDARLDVVTGGGDPSSTLHDCTFHSPRILWIIQDCTNIYISTRLTLYK